MSHDARWHGHEPHTEYRRKGEDLRCTDCGKLREEHEDPPMMYYETLRPEPPLPYIEFGEVRHRWAIVFQCVTSFGFGGGACWVALTNDLTPQSLTPDEFEKFEVAYKQWAKMEALK